MKLYEITAAIENAINDVFSTVNEDGEVSAEALKVLEELQIAKDEKIENIGVYIKNLLAEAKALKQEEENLKARREAKERKAEYLKNYLAAALNGEKFESPRVACSWRKSEVVTIPDVDLIPEQFTTTETTIKADKKAIKEAIKAGQEVRGAFLETRNNLQIK